MRKYLLLISCCLSIFISQGQEFVKAPPSKKAIKSIVEWTRQNEKAETTKGFVHSFDKNGNCIAYKNEELGDAATFTYDDKNRLITKDEGKLGNHSITKIVYNQDHTVKETHHSNIIYKRQFKTLEFFNKKGNKIEEKVFVKGDKIGDSFTLMQRTVYNYDTRDSLFGEMEYQYIDNNWKKMKTKKRKTIHYYNAETNRKDKIVYYNFDNSIKMTSAFSYTDDGQLKTISHNNAVDGATKIIDYIYKDGQLWQEKMKLGNYKSYINIYKNGLKIRSRSYLGKELVDITDYQYIYYE